jgi:hypothetical protein
MLININIFSQRMSNLLIMSNLGYKPTIFSVTLLMSLIATINNLMGTIISIHIAGFYLFKYH